jgi:hypothetical protein
MVAIGGKELRFVKNEGSPFTSHCLLYTLINEAQR